MNSTTEQPDIPEVLLRELWTRAVYGDTPEDRVRARAILLEQILTYPDHEVSAGSTAEPHAA